MEDWVKEKGCIPVGDWVKDNNARIDDKIQSIYKLLQFFMNEWGVWSKYVS